MRNLFFKRFELMSNNKNLTHIDVSIYYYNNNCGIKCYKLSILPIKVENNNGYITNSYEMYSGKTCILEYVKRKTQKLNEIYSKFDYIPYLEEFCKENNFQLKEGV